MDFLIFFTVFLSIYFGIHYFVYIRIAQTLGLSGGAKRNLRIFFFLAGLSFLAAMFTLKRLESFLLFHFGSVWFGVIAIAFGVFVVRELFAVFLREWNKQLTVASLVIVACISLYSLYNAYGPPVIKEVAIPLENLSPRLSGFKIALISDLHLTRHNSLEWLGIVVEYTNDLNPDLIAITGDLIGDDTEGLSQHAKILGGLKATYGVLAVTGNHEYYAGLENFFKIAERNGWKVLDNQTISIAGGLEVIGIDDREADSYTDYKTVLTSLFMRVDSGKPVLLLSHRPEPFNAAAALGVDLMLAGHTHAGQIPPIEQIVMLFIEYPYGLYRKYGSFLYTTCGTSTWGPPMRFLSKSEIVLFTLVPA